MKSLSKQFIDRLRIFVQAGSGAPGNPVVRGKGGDGGNVILEAKENQTLSKLIEANPTKRFKAKHGMEASKRFGLTVGHDGEDLIIPVPTGISVLFGGQGNSNEMLASKNSFKLLGNLDKPGQRLIVAQGGFGGIPQNGYLGIRGQAHAIILDLKLISDYSLIGFPNAGKSSLLKAISGAPTKIANYPFTTIRPQIAICRYPDHRQISLTDLPGLDDIYASYSDKNQFNSNNNNNNMTSNLLPNLRHTNFLKHVERSSCILMILDCLGFCKNQHSPYRNAISIAYLILNQLERWSNGLLVTKPMCCILNKIDLPGGMDIARETKYLLERLDSNESREASKLPEELLPRYVPKFESIQLVSAEYGTNIPELKQELRTCLDRIELRKRKNELEIPDNCEYLVKYSSS